MSRLYEGIYRCVEVCMSVWHDINFDNLHVCVHVCVHISTCAGVQGMAVSYSTPPNHTGMHKQQWPTILCLLLPSKPQSGFEAVVVFPLEGSLVIGSGESAHRGSSHGTSLKMKKKRTSN